jgi:hypothetical protein
MLSHDLTCYLHLVLLWLIIHEQGDEYESRNFSLCRFFHSPDIHIRLSSKYSSKHFDLRHIQRVRNCPILSLFTTYKLRVETEYQPRLNVTLRVHCNSRIVVV